MYDQQEEQEVKVGEWLGPRREFLGRVLSFTGRRIGVWTDHRRSRGKTDRGTTYILYENGDQYRMYVEEWSTWDGERSSSVLSRPGSLEDMKAAYPAAISAMGWPDEVDLDQEERGTVPIRPILDKQSREEIAALGTRIERLEAKLAALGEWILTAGEEQD